MLCVLMTKCQTGPWLCFFFFFSLLLFFFFFFFQAIVCFCGKIFCWKYRYREIILYIVIYKCVQRIKYINGFCQWGSMHELFLKMTTCRGGGVTARFPNLIKSYRSMLNILLFVLPQKKKKKSCSQSTNHLQLPAPMHRQRHHHRFQKMLGSKWHLST